MRKKVSRKKHYFVIGIIFVLFLILLIILENQPNQCNIVFEVAEGNSLIEIETEQLSENLLNKTDTFYGLLHDTGVLNMLYTYRFDGEKAYSRRYYLKERIFNDRLKSIWVRIDGKYSNIEHGKEEIDADNFERLTELDKRIEDAKDYSCLMVNRNRLLYDLNNYKETERFKKAFSEFQNVNLNMLRFRPDSTLIFIDFNKMIVGISCGEKILRETIVRGDYLTYEAIYDLNNGDLIKVIIVNTGYFME